MFSVWKIWQASFGKPSHSSVRVICRSTFLTFCLLTIPDDGTTMISKRRRCTLFGPSIFCTATPGLSRSEQAHNAIDHGIPSKSSSAALLRSFLPARKCKSQSYARVTVTCKRACCCLPRQQVTACAICPPKSKGTKCEPQCMFKQRVGHPELAILANLYDRAQRHLDVVCIWRCRPASDFTLACISGFNSSSHLTPLAGVKSPPVLVFVFESSHCQLKVCFVWSLPLFGWLCISTAERYAI